MGETMSFPKTLDEFIQQYQIVDTEKVYTNGARLIPVFRIVQWEAAHEPRKGKKFIEIVAEYPDPAICTYPEYKEKPYYSIRYEEDGEKIEGFGTYKLEVLSEYIREYFIGGEKETVSNPDPDVVKVVRCQDCKYHESIKMASGYLSFCRKHRLIDDLMRSDFCSDGERRNKTNE